jgi:hypothetical protein
LDAVFAEVSRTAMTRRCAFGEAAAGLARYPSPELAATVVAGKPFAHWDLPEQLAMLLATVTHFATGEDEGGSVDRWTERWGEVHVLPIMTALRAAAR